MQNLYTISTVDSPEYKQLICGRTGDLRVLLDQHISCGHSVALFGERRIGKTSLLYIVRDIISREMNAYRDRLIDKELQPAIPEFMEKTIGRSTVYVDCLGLEEKNLASLASRLSREFGIEANTFDDIFRSLNQAQTKSVVLLDEIDVFLGKEEGEQVFQSLRSVIQSFPNISFVLAGGEGWYKQIKDKVSPLTNNVFSFYLKAAEWMPIEKYLIRGLLAESLDKDLDKVTDTIREWTQGKPWYVQAVCYELVELWNKKSKLEDNWKEALQKNVEDSVNNTLRAFFETQNLESESQKILNLLAHKPGLSKKQIIKFLGLSGEVVHSQLEDLLRLDKVREQKKHYRISNSLLEKWGKENKELPALRPFLQREKGKIIGGATAALFLLLYRIYIFFFVSQAFLLEDWNFSVEKELFYEPKDLYYEKETSFRLVREESLAIVIPHNQVSEIFLYKIEQCLDNSVSYQKIRNTLLLSFRDKNARPSILEKLAKIEEIAYILPAYKIGSSLFFFTGRIRIVFKDAATKEEKEQLIQQYAMEVESSYDYVFFVTLPKRDRPIFDILQKISRNNIVESANLDFSRLPESIPLTNDRYVRHQWYIDACGFHYLLKRHKEFSKQQVSIALIDYGSADTTHEDLKEVNFAKKEYLINTPQQRKDYGKSATAIAGLVGAIKDNQKGICGLGPDGIKLYLFDLGEMPIEKCIQDATNKGVQIIHIAVPLKEGKGKEFFDALRYALSKNISIIVPAEMLIRNKQEKENLWNLLIRDDDFKNILVVGAISKDKDIVRGSAYSELDWESDTKNVTIYAGGLNVLTCSEYLKEKEGTEDWIGDKKKGETEEEYNRQRYIYRFFNGTPLASSMVAAAVAWMKEAYPEATPKEVKEILVKSADIYNETRILNAGKSFLEAQEAQNRAILHALKKEDSKTD